jgi:hypothetical protein
MKQPNIKPRLARPKEAQEILRVGKTKLDEMIKSGVLESYLLGARTRVITMESINRIARVEEPST